MKQEINILPTKARNPYWDDTAKRGQALATTTRTRGETLAIIALRKRCSIRELEERRTLTRKIKARRYVLVALGIALFEQATGERPIVRAPKRAPTKPQAVVVSLADLLG